MYIWSPLPRSLGATFRDAEHEKPRIRISAIADLARWVGTQDRESCVRKLIALVETDTDVEVRATAALALADAGAAEGLGALLEAAHAGPPRLRQMALVAIGELAEPGDAAAIRVVLGALRCDAPALRFQALVAAGRLLTSEQLLPCLLTALSDAESKLRYVACRIADERFSRNEGVEDAAVASLNARFCELCADPEREVALAAAVSLAARGSAPAIELMIRALNGRRGFSQIEDEQAAIELCADMHLDAARPGLAARAFGGIFGGSSPLAFQARVALARLGDERACQQIVRGLSSWSRSTRAQSVAAAGLARLQAARPRLLEMRANGRADQSSVDEALLALDR